MPLDLSMISSKEEFINYFIYYYEYTFVADESIDIDIKKELQQIVEKANFDDFKDLWIYTYLRITLVLLKNYPLVYLKETIKNLAKNFKSLDSTILEIQLELIKDILNEVNAYTLEIRPYEQLKLSSPYGDYLLKQEKSLIKFIDKNQEYFSETLVNKCCYVKIKNQKYINYSTLLFELYSVILFETIQDSLEPDFEIEDIDDKINEFIKSFKKGKLNKEVFEELKSRTIKYVLEYKQIYKLIEQMS